MAISTKNFCVENPLKQMGKEKKARHVVNETCAARSHLYSYVVCFFQIELKVIFGFQRISWIDDKSHGTFYQLPCHVTTSNIALQPSTTELKKAAWKNSTSISASTCCNTSSGTSAWLQKLLYFEWSPPWHVGWWLSGGGCQGELEVLFSQLVTKNHEETPHTCFLDFCVLLLCPARPSV